MSQQTIFKDLSHQHQRKKKLEYKLEIIAGTTILLSSVFLGNITGAVIGTSQGTDTAIGMPLAILGIVLTLAYLCVRLGHAKPKL
jgi:uncharacterized Tic20 family protein